MLNFLLEIMQHMMLLWMVQMEYYEDQLKY
jgi:hypothetical protein